MSLVNHSRRSLLRGQLNSLLPQRPPWVDNESQFIDNCTQCNNCIESCEEQVLLNGSAGFPEINFDNSGCTFCGVCSDVCETNAINKALFTRPSTGKGAFSSTANIKTNCLAHSQVACQSCKEICEVRAISFDWVNRTPLPKVNSDLCNGCGFCVGVCPTQSIEVTQA